MSSRGQFIGKGPSAGQYQPRPLPQDLEGLPAYLNDELLLLGGQVNELFQGGGFPNVSRLPDTWIDGRMYNFSPAPEDVYEYGPLAGQRIITSAGVWQYRVIERDINTQKPTNFKWIKLIDDPLDIVGGTFIYQLGTETQPNVPTSGVALPPAGWSLEPPQKIDKSNWIWASTVASNDSDFLTWTQPVPWSAGVVDGIDGDDGAPGLDGRIFEQWFQESATTPQVPSNVYPLTSPWSTTPPSDPTNPVWMIFIKVREDGTDPVYPWSFPQQITGTDGEVGAVGPTGPAGADGKRGTLNVSVSTTATSWSNSVAYNAIINDANSGGVINYWDTVTLYNTSAQFSEQRYYTGGTGSSSTWQTVQLFVDGDAIINGTIAANKLVANSITSSQISAGTITGNEINSGTSITIGGSATDDVVVLSATDSNARIWVGDVSSSSANFRVDPSGNVYANSGYFGGEVTAGGLTGAIGGATGIWSDASWLLTSATSLPQTQVSSVTIPYANYDREMYVTWTPSILVGNSRTNCERFGVRWTSLNSTNSPPSRYRMIPASTSTAGVFNMIGLGNGSLDYLGQNSNSSLFSLLGSVTWRVELPANSSSGSFTLPFKVILSQPTDLSYPIGSLTMAFNTYDSVTNVQVSKVNSGITVS